MPTTRVITGIKAHKKAIGGIKNHKKIVHHNKTQGGALKHMIPCEEQEYGTNLQKLRHSLKTMHISQAPHVSRQRKRYVEI